MDPNATYTLSQGGHQYGPFALEQLRDHVSQGSIQRTDLKGLASLVGAIATTWAYFWMRSAVETRFGLDLSGVMTFFFNMLYLQYHMTEIADRDDAARWQRLQA